MAALDLTSDSVASEPLTRRVIANALGIDCEAAAVLGEGCGVLRPVHRRPLIARNAVW